MTLYKPAIGNVIETDILGISDNFTELDTGYRYVQTVYYTANGTFEKAGYSWLRAIRVITQAAGGGGAGAGTTGAGQNSVGGSGGGGAYAETFITDIASLAASVNVAVGAGGAGSAGVNPGSTGGTTSFGLGLAYEVSAVGGSGGGTPSLQTPIDIRQPSDGGLTGTGGIVIPGGPAGATISYLATQVTSPTAGSSKLGFGALPARVAGGTNGNHGKPYGGGGGGGANRESEAAERTGGNGAPGILIVELYA